jgi:NADH-quinone oxidoreductase subunit L
VVLAVVTCFVGLLGFAPVGAPFLDWVYFGAPEEAIFSPTVALISIVAVAIGLYAGWVTYRRYREPDPTLELGKFSTLLVHKYYLDDFYWNAIVLPVRDRASAAVYWFNQNVLDGIVNGAAVVAYWFSGVIMWIDRNVIDGAVNGAGTAMETFGKGLRTLQSGKVQWYAVGLFAGVIVLTAFFVR